MKIFLIYRYLTIISFLLSFCFPQDYLWPVKAKKEITELAENHLSTHSAKAANRLVELLDEDGTTPHASIRLAAANQILDRVGIAKKEKLDVNVKAVHGLFILPPKDAIRKVEPINDDKENI